MSPCAQGSPRSWWRPFGVREVRREYGARELGTGHEHGHGTWDVEHGAWTWAGMYVGACIGTRGRRWVSAVVAEMCAHRGVCPRGGMLRVLGRVCCAALVDRAQGSAVWCCTYRVESRLALLGIRVCGVRTVNVVRSGASPGPPSRVRVRGRAVPMWSGPRRGPLRCARRSGFMFRPADLVHLWSIRLAWSIEIDVSRVIGA